LPWKSCKNCGKTSSVQKYYLSNQWRNGGETNNLQFREFVNMINQVFPEYEVEVVGGEYVFRLK